MKALKSKLAAQLLADPVAREQLRTFLASRRGESSPEPQRQTEPFLIRSREGGVWVAAVVPKAAG